MFPSFVIEKWAKILEKNVQFINGLQDKFQEYFDSKFEEEVESFENDESDEIVFIGRVENGLKQGRGTLSNLSKGFSLEGFYFNDKLVGNVLLKKENGSKELFFCKKGVRHGYSRSLDEKNKLLHFGIFLNGKKSGTWWHFWEGGGYVVTDFERGEIIFIYPDMNICLVGVWQDDVMLKSGKARVSGVKEVSGILYPVIDKVDTSVNYKFEPRRHDSICDEPLMEDPYENETVEVRESLISGAGEGLFTLKFIPKGRLICYFNGSIMEKTHVSDYSIALDAKTVLDVPEDYRSITRYKATLGHKICHSFTPNADYAYAQHTRFGPVRCGVA